MPWSLQNTFPHSRSVLPKSCGVNVINYSHFIGENTEFQKASVASDILIPSISLLISTHLLWTSPSFTELGEPDSLHWEPWVREWTFSCLFLAIIRTLFYLVWRSVLFRVLKPQFAKRIHRFSLTCYLLPYSLCQIVGSHGLCHYYLLLCTNYIKTLPSSFSEVFLNPLN